MISRRGFFGMLAGMAAAPLIGPKVVDYLSYSDMAFVPGVWQRRPGLEKWEPCTAYKDGDRLAVTGVCEPIYFRCGTSEMGTLYWSKENS